MQYFVVHAPRQVGKTTALLALAQELTAEGSHVAVLFSMEQGALFSKDPGAAERAILDAWRRSRARLPPDLQPPPWPDAAPGNRIGSALRAWAEAAPRPLVLFLDEIDALQDESLISVLRQLRDGYPDRPGHFPASLVLIGLRDVRDYKITWGGGGAPAPPARSISSPTRSRCATSHARRWRSSMGSTPRRRVSDSCRRPWIARSI